MRKECFHVFDSHRKDKNGNVSAADTADLLKLESLSSLQNYIVSVFYPNYAMTLWCQIQSIRLSYTLEARNRITNSIESRKKTSDKKKYHANPSTKKEYEKENTRRILNWKTLSEKETLRK